MINKNISILPLVITTLGISSVVNSQTISDEVFKNIDGNRVWQVQVDCEDSRPLLTKAVDSEQWCISNSSTCFTDKQVAAAQACQTGDLTEEEDDDDYEEEEGDELAIDYDSLTKEKQTLKAQSLDIQQQILQLKKNEIALKKRLLELK